MPKRKRGSAKCCPKDFKGTEFCHRSSQIVLSDLPNEILRHILEYLDPESLVAILNLNIQRLNKQFYDIRSADFSVCNTIGSQDLMSYFSRERALRLKELNFNNVFFVQPTDLVACIKKCKNITKLHVFNCGINYAHLLTICANCTHLEDLYWSIKVESYDKHKLTFKSIKKIYLQVHANDNTTSIWVATKLYVKCPNIKEFVLNYSPYYVTSLPANSATKYFTLKPFACFPFHILVQCEAESFPNELLQFVKLVSVVLDIEVNDFNRMDDFPRYLTYVSPFLQFFDTSMPTIAPVCLKSMVMILSKNGKLLNYPDLIESVTGKDLKHLSLYQLMPDDENDADDSPYIRDVLCDLVANSCNITVLDLSKMHMKFAFPFSALSHLKRLKVLNISTCCFVLCKEQEYSVTDYLNSFQNFVLQCNEVDTFCIYDCKAGCISPPMNDLLVPVSKWPQLKSLTVKNVKALRECQFLIPIADSCPKLQFLEFIAVGETKVCLFMTSIKHILIKAKELKFLRINHSGLYPMNSLLWNNIEKAQKLQGLCLTTELSTSIVNKTVLRAIHKLPYLHLFHLLAKNCCENLSQLVKREMTSKGVRVPDVKTSHHYNGSYKECTLSHFPLCDA